MNEINQHRSLLSIHFNSFPSVKCIHCKENDEENETETIPISIVGRRETIKIGTNKNLTEKEDDEIETATGSDGHSQKLRRQSGLGPIAFLMIEVYI